MRDLVRQLTDAHRAAEAAFLANASASLASLRGILIGECRDAPGPGRGDGLGDLP